ncbi:hypothetical protein P3102_22740 [Amycolatopsis sp. QT-25]|uniref:hypothetical protein n=1 Tax=Amycolatopsis sp. QT-25 TaxID=3034022 RepID=UPI0023ED5B85|nr:hypothetical protein [Amycolatopsis sp. QT-25]WET76923.1 hypothetical protein P3102_22740 [Amycolatopsis sp. QT-25]
MGSRLGGGRDHRGGRTGTDHACHGGHEWCHGEETACYAGTTICNNTYGKGDSISEVVIPEPQHDGGIRVLRAFRPGISKQTGPTDRESAHPFRINARFPSGSLICVSFWNRSAHGSLTKVGGQNGNACTSIPIG